MLKVTNLVFDITLHPGSLALESTVFTTTIHGFKVSL